MDRAFGVDDVLGGPTPWSVMVRRGLRRRCPRCGGGDVFRSRYRMVDRCPTCGYRFEREPGFFLGAWFLNFMLVEAVHFALVMVFIGWKATHPEAGIAVPLAAGVASGFVLPILCYPWSQTVWAAIDLAMTPLELHEIVDAADALEGASPRIGDGDGDDRPFPDAGGASGSGDPGGAGGRPQ